MNKFFLTFWLLFTLIAGVTPSLSAQTKLYIYPTTVVAPVGSYQTVTAIVNGPNDKTVTWTTDGGTLVGTNPCVVNEPCTIALHVTSTGTYHLTAKSNANNAIVGTSTITVTGSPTPVTTHPRLQYTAAQLPALRAKGVPSNQSYAAVLNYVNNYVFPRDNSTWSWTTWNGSSCAGPGTGQPSSAQYGIFFNANYYAWLSLMSANASDRNTWGCHARDLWVYEMQEITSGADAIGGNTWSDNSDSLSFTTDWLMAGGYLSPSDLTVARAYLYKLAQLIASFQNGYTPPVAAFNNPAQYTHGVTSNGSDLVHMRLLGNNYSLSRTMMMMSIGLTFNDDTTDDPPLTNTCGATRYQVCPDFTAGSLHAFFKYAVGSMLYLDYAHLEDPTVSWKAYQTAYGAPTSKPTCQYDDGTYHDCFGDGRGGESSEGSWYQYSFVKLRWALNLMHTAGVDDPVLYGPQVSLATSSWWDLKYVADAEFLTAFPHQTGAATPAYAYLTTGDTFNYSRNPQDFMAEALMMASDAAVGRTDRTNALNWLMLNSAGGGPLGTSAGCTTHCGFDNALTNNLGNALAPIIFPFAPDNPTGGTLPTDPRPGLPTDWFNGSNNQHQLVRSGWTNPTMVSTYCPNSLENHEYNFCGRFDVFANNEFITKGRVEFNDYNNLMSASMFQNTLSIPNTNSTACSANGCVWYQMSANGGQWPQGDEAGFNYPLHSELSAYTATSVDDTGSYNGWWCYNQPYDSFCYTNVSGSSRDMVYLRGTNQIVVHSRASLVTGTANITDNLITTGPTTISSNTASWSTRSGTQKAYYTSVLPVSAALTAKPLISFVSTSAQYAHLANGASEQVTCTLHYADGSTVDCTNTAIWSSSNSSVLSVNSTGLVTSKSSSGYAYIFANVAAGNTNGYGVMNADTTSNTTWVDSSDMDEADDWEPYKQLQVSGGSVSSENFLAVLEWGASGLTKSATNLLQSNAGQNYEGTIVGSSAIVFAKTITGSFTGTTYPASGATTHYVANLSPNTTYAVTAVGAPTSATTDSAGVLTFTATGTGNVTVGAASGGNPGGGGTPPTGVPVSVFSGVTLSGHIIIH